MFSWENLDNAATAYQKLIKRIAALQENDGPVDEAVAKEYREKFLQQLGNDLNTAQGVTLLYDVLKAKTNDATKRAILASFDQVLSLSLLEKAAELREKPRRPRPLPPPAATPSPVKATATSTLGAGPVRSQEGEKLRRGRPHPG